MPGQRVSNPSYIPASFSDTQTEGKMTKGMIYAIAGLASMWWAALTDGNNHLNIHGNIGLLLVVMAHAEIFGAKP